MWWQNQALVLYLKNADTKILFMKLNEIIVLFCYTIFFQIRVNNMLHSHPTSPKTSTHTMHTELLNAKNLQVFISFLWCPLFRLKEKPLSCIILIFDIPKSMLHNICWALYWISFTNIMMWIIHFGFLDTFSVKKREKYFYRKKIASTEFRIIPICHSGVISVLMRFVVFSCIKAYPEIQFRPTAFQNVV